MTHRLTLALAALAALLLVAAGCAGRQSPASTSTSVRPAAAVPKPRQHRVLALTGAIRNPNSGRSLVLDVPALDRMGLTTISLYEPFKKRRMHFRAIPLRNLLDVAEVGRGATTLHSIALNDYSVDIPLDIARGDGVYLATHNGDGSPIPVADGGPIRIVFLDGAKGGSLDNYWIWSLDAVDLK